MFVTQVTPYRIDPSQRQACFVATHGSGADCGAISTFLGVVRDVGQAGARVKSLTLEHYPGMTERKLAEFTSVVRQRWQLQGVDIVHRHGKIEAGEVIVHVLVAARHRRDALAACAELVERLKHDAPFWKKECGPQGEHWVTLTTDDA